MIGEVIYNDEDIKMLEEIRIMIGKLPIDKDINKWTELKTKLEEFIERMRF